MEKLVNIEGIELEQCVLDGDELDFNPSTDDYSDYENYEVYPDSEIVEIPESEQDEFIREYIEKEMDKHPENIEEWEHLQTLGNQELEVMPSCYSDAKSATDIIIHDLDLNGDTISGQVYLIEKGEVDFINNHIYWLYTNDIYNIKFPEMWKFLEHKSEEWYNNVYLPNYQKELRDWWFKRKQDKLDGRQ